MSLASWLSATPNDIVDQWAIDVAGVCALDALRDATSGFANLDFQHAAGAAKSGGGSLQPQEQQQQQQQKLLQQQLWWTCRDAERFLGACNGTRRSENDDGASSSSTVATGIAAADGCACVVRLFMSSDGVQLCDGRGEHAAKALARLRSLAQQAEQSWPPPAPQMQARQFIAHFASDSKKFEQRELAALLLMGDSKMFNNNNNNCDCDCDFDCLNYIFFKNIAQNQNQNQNQNQIQNNCVNFDCTNVENNNRNVQMPVNVQPRNNCWLENVIVLLASSDVSDHALCNQCVVPTCSRLQHLMHFPWMLPLIDAYARRSDTGSTLSANSSALLTLLLDPYLLNDGDCSKELPNSWSAVFKQLQSWLDCPRKRKARIQYLMMKNNVIGTNSNNNNINTNRDKDNNNNNNNNNTNNNIDIDIDQLQLQLEIDDDSFFRSLFNMNKKTKKNNDIDNSLLCLFSNSNSNSNSNLAFVSVAPHSDTHFDKLVNNKNNNTTKRSFEDYESEIESWLN